MIALPPITPRFPPDWIWQYSRYARMTAEDHVRYECESWGMSCFGPPIARKLADQLRKDPGFEVHAQCMVRGLFPCKDDRAHLSFSGAVTYKDAPRDRYYSLRKMPYRAGASGEQVRFGWCLFFRRGRFKGRNVLPFDSCEVCSNSTWSFLGEPRCNIGGVWKSTGFADVENSIHHNMGFLSQIPDKQHIDDSAVAFGGRYPGIWRLTAKAPAQGSDGLFPAHDWHFHPEVEVSQFHPGCLDLKLSHEASDAGFTWSCRYPHCGCSFDGRFSAVLFRGEVLLYVRANVKPEGGGRYVQVTRAPAQQRGADEGLVRDGSQRTWSAFRLIHVMGYDMFSGDIYFFNVFASPVTPDTLLAVFPVVDHRSNQSSIAMSCSKDGIWWSPIVQLLFSPRDCCGRTLDHPVDGIEVSRDAISLFIHRSVPGVVPREHNFDPLQGLLKYSMTMEKLRTITDKALAKLEEDMSRYPIQVPESDRLKNIQDRSIRY